MSSFLKGQAEKDAFPNIGTFLQEYEPRRHGPAEIDVVRFFSYREPAFVPDVRDFSSRPIPAPGDGIAELYIIEGMDVSVARRLLESCIGAHHRTSFLQFLEEFLDANPSYNFDHMQNHFQPRMSTAARQRHVCFQVMGIREFDGDPKLERPDLLRAIEEEKRTWKDARLHGLLLPAQRTEGDTTTPFAPCVLSRNHFASWFDDDDTGQGWRIGVVLVDRLLQLDDLEAELKPPAYGKLAMDNVLLPPPNTSSYRTALSYYMCHNPDIPTKGVPSPFVALQDLFRIISAEWIILNTYITRDLNDIGWTLLGGNSALRSHGRFDKTIDVLFSTQWRLGWILHLAEKPLQACREHGNASWSVMPPTPYRNSSNETALSAVLVKDFEYVLAQLNLSSTRVEQSINHVMALTGVVHTKQGLKETGRAITQNNVLLVLSSVAILFLPASLLSAIFSMQGDWGPGQPHFGWYWAIVISVSAVLFVPLMALQFWPKIRRAIRRRRAARFKKRQSLGPKSPEDIV